MTGLYNTHMDNKYIFDVDGTLTPSRGLIDAKFGVWFANFCDNNEVYLVTGSDRPKTVEQLGMDIINKCQRLYNCSGSDVWEGDVNIRTSTWKLSIAKRIFLEEMLEQSPFVIRTGSHIEERPGSVNFSVVGRNATQEQREAYIAHDKKINERLIISELFEDRFTRTQATVGGETGLDIGPRGADKSQILTDFNDDDTLVFFGDAMFKGGNDYPLAQAITNGTSHQVDGWQHTFELLKNNYK